MHGQQMEQKSYVMCHLRYTRYCRVFGNAAIWDIGELTLNFYQIPVQNFRR